MLLELATLYCSVPSMMSTLSKLGVVVFLFPIMSMVVAVMTTTTFDDV